MNTARPAEASSPKQQHAQVRTMNTIGGCFHGIQHAVKQRASRCSLRGTNIPEPGTWNLEPGTRNPEPGTWKLRC